MAQALRLFAVYDVTAVVAILDTGMHPPELLRDFRQGQATKIEAAGTPQHHPELVKQLRADADRWRQLSDASTMQAYAAIAAVETVIRDMPVYYALREPKELGLFRWTIDAKSLDGLTNAEDLWKKFVCPFLQDLFLQELVMAVQGLDYSHYEKSYGSAWRRLPDYLAPHLKPGYDPAKGRITDLKQLMLGDLRFESSEVHAGLQVADIIGSASTRALNRTLGFQGWKRLGRLLLRRRGPPIKLVALGPGVEGREQRDEPVRAPVATVMSRLNRYTKSMFPT